MYFLYLEAGLVFRIDSLAADHQPDKAVFSMEGLKGLFIVPGAPFGCAKSFEIKVIWVTVKLGNEFEIQFYPYNIPERKPRVTTSSSDLS